MIKRFLAMAWRGAVLVVCLLTAATVGADQQFLGLITGNPRSTAHQMGMDIKAMAKQHDLHVAVFNSAGAVENIYAVYQRPGNHIGLVQSDVLAFVAKVDGDPELKLIADKIKWVYPLHMQPVHVLAHKSIRRFVDMAGKRIAVGSDRNGTYLTSRLLFEIAGIVPAQLIRMDEEKSLAALKEGRVDAMIIIDGFPSERLASDLAPGDDVHLLPVDNKDIRGFYPVWTIPAGGYPWQETAVETVAVRSVMVAYDFRNRHCYTIGRLASLIKENLNWLRRSGHPAWKTVDLKYTVTGWDRYKCVQRFNPSVSSTGAGPSFIHEPNPVADAIEAVFQP
ncbi:MAG: TRAP transporter substrate-binding protein [Proteobacteria bacterium]|nr:MAG: TRAP transporter substrate-binding protein [Pseudomonadota bacterium]PIE67045.1 MAG: TRAP transporter substrate-binding protein [Deltaproteobacteria bacterium]